MFRRTKIWTGLMLAFGGGVLSTTTGALAQQSDAPQRIEITGSSIKRVDAETALPVTVLKREDIERTGATTAQDLVNMMPSNFFGTTTAQNVGATNAVASTANLRALGAKYTLVLLNGRRVANYALGNSPVDLNSIPLSAIERIEVLRDGASAIYGADAIAGVINFILRKDYQGIEGTVYGTHVDQGGGNSRSVNITGGFGDLSSNRFNVLLSANHEEDDVLKATDRWFGSTANRPDLGINKASPRNGIPNLNFTDTRGNGYGTQSTIGTSSVNPFRYQNCNNPEYALVVNGATTCGTDYVHYIDLIPKQTHDNVVAKGTFQLNEDIEFFAEGAYTKDKVSSTYSPAPYTRTMTYPANGRFYPTSITLPKGMTLPAGYVMPDGTVLATATVLQNDMAVTPTGPITGTWRTVAGGGRQDVTESTNTRFLVGSRGTLLGWDYDGAVSRSRNKAVTTFGNGQYSYNLLTPRVLAGDINVFGAQDAQSLAALQSASIAGQYEQGATSTADELDFRISREVAKLPAGPLGIAVGVSARREKLEQNPGDVLLIGDNVGGGGSVPAVTGSRKVYGIFGEATIPIITGLEADVAARYDNYKNSFGTSFNRLSPKIALRFQPSKEWLVRGSYGEGFRAPTLYENLRPRTTDGNTNANWSDPVRCPNGTPVSSPNVVDPDSECNVQLTAGTQGDINLKPEKSKQYSLGFVFSPTASFSGSIDYWDVKIENAIVPKSEIAVLSNPSRFVNNYYRYDPQCDRSDPATPNCADFDHPVAGSSDPNLPLAYVFLPYENAAKIYAAGVDLNLNYRQKFGGLGEFGASLEATYFTKHGYGYTDLPGSTSDLGSYGDFGPVPRWRSVTTLTWAMGVWNASLTNNYTQGYQDYINPTETFSDAYPEHRKVKAYSTWDIQGGWRGLKNLEVVLGVKNLFDTDPPSSRTEVNFQTGYDAAIANPLGRTYYARVRYKFM